MLWVRTFLAELHAWQWLGIFVARLAVGLLFFLSGRGKLFVPEQREQMRERLRKHTFRLSSSTLFLFRQ
jgi:uncharacterized membrane protein YphA (DoxX/SURF4 family)